MRTKQDQLAILIIALQTVLIKAQQNSVVDEYTLITSSNDTASIKTITTTYKGMYDESCTKEINTQKDINLMLLLDWTYNQKDCLPISSIVENKSINTLLLNKLRSTFDAAYSTKLI